MMKGIIPDRVDFLQRNLLLALHSQRLIAMIVGIRSGQIIAIAQNIYTGYNSEPLKTITACDQECEYCGHCDCSA